VFLPDNLHAGKALAHGPCCSTEDIKAQLAQSWFVHQAGNELVPFLVVFGEADKYGEEYEKISFGKFTANQ
jgi:hypothetical protein